MDGVDNYWYSTAAVAVRGLVTFGGEKIGERVLLEGLSCGVESLLYFRS